ncbi:MAG: carbohydrate ABC transporter permease [Lachnospiraceae bacterium]|nr:carbohydrate ABC transporter permease [Lachnospiraceae bacterium]
MSAATIRPKKRRHDDDFIKRSRGEKIFNACNIIFMALLLIFLLYPVLNVISISVSNETQVMAANVTFYPIGYNPQAYTTIFKDNELWHSIWNTTFVSGVGCVLSLIALSIAAYPLAFGRFYGKKIYTMAIMITMWFQGGIVPMFLTMQSLGLYDNLWALIFHGLISAYNVVIIRSYFNSIPMSVIESARIDGANDFRILFRLVIPLSKPVLATVALWVIVGHWNDYMNPLILVSSTANKTLQLELKSLVLAAESSTSNLSTLSKSEAMKGVAALNTQIKNAVLVVSMIPMIAIYPFIQRFFVSGVMLGSVKG